MEPVNSYQTGLESLYKELVRQLNDRNASNVEVREIIAWYLSYGFNLGYKRADLEASFLQQPELQQIATDLSENEISEGKPVPEYIIGDNVEVIVNGRNTTYHRGVIVSVNWHHKDKQWNYILEANGKKVSKRYGAQDITCVNV